MAELLSVVHSPAQHVLGTPAQLRAEADRLESARADVLDVISARTGKPKPVVDEWLSKDTWFDAEQALAAGLVDEIVDPAPAPLLENNCSPTGSGTSREPTEQERLFKIWLAAHGPVDVRDRSAFGRELWTWFQTNVRKAK